LNHDLIVIKDKQNHFKKLDILIANYQWENDGLLFIIDEITEIRAQ